MQLSRVTVLLVATSTTKLPPPFTTWPGRTEFNNKIAHNNDSLNLAITVSSYFVRTTDMPTSPQQKILISTVFRCPALALISDYLEEAQLLLLRPEIAAKTVGLHVNYKKTEYML